MDIERRSMGVTRFVRPLEIEGQKLRGMVWHTGLGAEVPVTATLPRNLEPERAMAAAAAGELVLLGNDRLGWART